MLIIRWIVVAVALYLTVIVGQAMHIGLVAKPGIHGIIGMFGAALLIGILNAIIRPIAELISLPLTCLTLGLFSIVVSLIVNILVFWFVGHLDIAFKVYTFEAAAIGAIAVSVISSLLNFFVGAARKDDTN